MEESFRKLNPKAKSCMRMTELVSGVSWVIISIVGYILVKKWVDDIPDWVILILAGTYVLCFISMIITPSIRYKRYRYCITEEKIDIIEGFWFITEEIAPIERVHQIEVLQGPIDRMFGLGKVVATTAGGSVTIRFLEKECADKIANDLQGNIRKTVRRQECEEGGTYGENEMS